MPGTRTDNPHDPASHDPASHDPASHDPALRDPASHDPAAYVEAVLAVVERIPSGRVMSYGAIADFLHERYGRSSARRVGTIMAQYGGSVPWHRVVSSVGRLPPGHEARARRLLEGEGVTFTGPHVAMPTYAWYPARPRPSEA